MSQVISNRVKFIYDDTNGAGDSFSVFIIDDEGEKIICRGNDIACIDGKNFFEMMFQFMQKDHARKQANSQVRPAIMAGMPPVPGQ